MNHRRFAVVISTALATSAVYAAGQGARNVSPDDEPVLGDPNARVTIVEFSDYQCEFCRIFWKTTLPQLRQEYIDAGEVKLVFRDFPQPDYHPEAMNAALAAACAADQDKYWEYHDKVFGEQDRRGKEREVVRFNRNDLKEWAAAIGLEPTAFNKCLDSRQHRREVEADRRDGLALDVKGTPTFFINWRPLVGAHPFSAFQKLIEEELGK